MYQDAEAVRGFIHVWSKTLQLCRDDILPKQGARCYCCHPLSAQVPTAQVPLAHTSLHSARRRADSRKASSLMIGAASGAFGAACPGSSRPPTVAASSRPVMRAATHGKQRHTAALRTPTHSLSEPAPARLHIQPARADHVCRAQQSSGADSRNGSTGEDLSTAHRSPRCAFCADSGCSSCRLQDSAAMPLGLFVRLTQTTLVALSTQP